MKARRNLNPQPALTPDFSQPVPNSKPDFLSDVQWWKRLLNLERRRHGKLETVLEKAIVQLERQVTQLERANEDLRSAYLQSLTLRPSENK